MGRGTLCYPSGGQSRAADGNAISPGKDVEGLLQLAFPRQLLASQRTLAVRKEGRVVSEHLREQAGERSLHRRPAQGQAR